MWCIFDACVHLCLQKWKQFKLYTLSSARQLLEGILHSKDLESKENVYSVPKVQVNFPLLEEVHACLQHLICNLVVALSLSCATAQNATLRHDHPDWKVLAPILSLHLVRCEV